MRAILIDPKAKQIMQIDYNGDYKTIYEHLSFTNSFGNSHKVRAFDIVRIPVGNDGIYVDDEGLYAPEGVKHWLWVAMKRATLQKRQILLMPSKGESLGDC